MTPHDIKANDTVLDLPPLKTRRIPYRSTFARGLTIPAMALLSAASLIGTAHAQSPTPGQSEAGPIQVAPPLAAEPADAPSGLDVRPTPTIRVAPPTRQEPEQNSAASPTVEDAADPRAVAAAAAESKPSGLLGMPVIATNGEEVGTVSNVKASSDGRVEEIHVKTGGFLGFFATTRVVPAGKFIETEKEVKLSMAPTEIDTLPEVMPQT